MKSGQLTLAELEEFTSYKRGEEQLQAFRSMGLHPYMGRDGHPRVTWEAITEALCGRVAVMQSAEPAKGGINWAAVGRRA